MAEERGTSGTWGCLQNLKHFPSEIFFPPFAEIRFQLNKSNTVADPPQGFMSSLERKKNCRKNDVVLQLSSVVNLRYSIYTIITLQNDQRKTPLKLKLCLLLKC